MKRSIGLRHLLGGAMALCIAFPMPEVTATALLAETLTAHAQDTEVRVPPRKTRVTHDLRPHHRERAEHAPSDYSGEESDSISRLPNFFPNCEHPAPRWCNDNY
jgi:hypothetical protein